MGKNILEKILEGNMEPTDLPLELLREITDGFSTDRIIGEGGFGTVYKGIVGNWNVAVKRIRSSMTIDDKLFRREVGNLMEVNHQNVVRFLGLCSHTVETPMKHPESQRYILVEIRERLLCFEYINKGSLDKIITDELRGLEWDQRYEIIKGICTGLNYLHMQQRILHMDLKPANVLLHNDMMPKITDFGLSRPTENSKTMSTSHFFSLGYCAPENLIGCGRMSVQSDIYSLGVIIVELVTGHKEIPETNDKILRRWRHRWNKAGKEASLKYHDQVTKCIEIGSLCQKVDPYARPSISAIMSKFVELESMNYCRTIAHESMGGQTKLPYWEDDMLGVEPLELQFANSGNEKQLILQCSVELSNNTDRFIAFEIQKTSPLPYSIEPNKEIVKPRSKCSVDITLPAANTRDHNNKKYTKEFIVRSIIVEEGLTTNDMNEDVFDKRIMGHHVDEIYLSVIFEESCNKEVMDSPSNQAKQYASSGMPRQLVQNVVGLILKIKQAAHRAKHNKEDCNYLVLHLSMIEDVLSTRELDPVFKVPLDTLYNTLQEAHNLVVACQKQRSYFKKLGLADRFREVNARITYDLALFPLLMHTAIARRLDRIIESSSSGTVSDDQPRIFTWAEITAATNNLAVVLGGGRSGTVYKGRLHDEGRLLEVVVKVLNKDGRHAMEDTFVAEVEILYPLRHDHIARLVGWCVEENRRMFVYEYMSNGTLRDHLVGLGVHGGGGGSPVVSSWKARIEVLLGVARALEHLHSRATLPVIHRNVTSSNILLDASWTSHLADFGQALLQGACDDHSDQGQLVPEAIGTFGYLDPEYYKTMRVSPASDVYSFGVVTLEDLTGRPHVSSSGSGSSEGKSGESPVTIVSSVVPIIQNGHLRDVLDVRPALVPTRGQLEALELVANTTILCLCPQGMVRPSMSSVVAKLDNALGLIGSDETTLVSLEHLQQMMHNRARKIG